MNHTQHEDILRYIEEFGSISPTEAFHYLGITKLSTRISEMKKSGIRFYQQMISDHNRYGKKIQYMRYWLVKENERNHSGNAGRGSSRNDHFTGYDRSL